MYIGERLFVGRLAGNLEIMFRPPDVRVRVMNVPGAISDHAVISKLERFGKVDKDRVQWERIRDTKWRDFENGTRIYYMTGINQEVGLPENIYIQNFQCAVRHSGQYRGKERRMKNAQIIEEEHEKRRNREERQNNPNYGQDLLNQKRAQWHEEKQKRKDADDIIHGLCPNIEKRNENISNSRQDTRWSEEKEAEPEVSKNSNSETSTDEKGQN